MEYRSKTAFVESIRHLDYPMMLKRAVEEGTAAERASGRYRHREYSSFLAGLIFWLRFGIHPAGLSREEFLLLRPLAEELVGKKQFKPAVLDMFAEEEKDATG